MQDLTIPHQITSYECGADKRMKPECFQHFCQEMAEMHADLNNLGYEWSLSNQLAWVQVQGDFEILQKPSWKDKVQMRTNTGKASALQARRFVEMTNEKGEVIARADLLWVLINLTTRRPVPFKRAGLDWDDTPCPCLTSDMPEHDWNTVTAAATSTVTAARRDVDFNGHINNSAYLIWVLDTLPTDITPGTSPARYRLQFRRESHSGEEMTITHYVQGTSSRHIIYCGEEVRAEITIEWC